MAGPDEQVVAALRAVAQATGTVVWMTDAARRLAGDSPSWREFTGRAGDEIGGTGWMDAVYRGDRLAFEARWAEAAAGGQPFEIEIQVERPGARHTRGLVRGTPVAPGEAASAWVMTLHEVWADESVRQSEERLRLATGTAQVAVWEYDFVAGHMTRTDNHDGLYGLEPQPVWTYDLFVSTCHPDDRALSDATVAASVMPGGPDDYAFDFRVIWPDGSIHWLAVNGHVVRRDETGQAMLVRGALIDVTRLKNVESELREAVRIRDDFLHVASHELRTPLTPLLLKLEHMDRIVRSYPESEALRRHLTTAQRQVLRLSGLVNDLLDVTRLASGRFELSCSRVSLADLVRAAVEQSALEAERAGCELRVSFADATAGWWDASQLERVVMNLVGNAIKFGRGRPIHIDCEAVDGGVRLRVRDEGDGIAPELMPRIFEKFERGAEHSAGGLGLGLYIVREIVTRHGGRITAANAADGGALFTIELPLED